ncbi:hypothetical protein K501DRAFT_4824, partial [Backusella circina FSU 941]
TPNRSSELLNIQGKKNAIVNCFIEKKQNPIPVIPPPQERKTFKIDASNDILSRVQAFLPQLQTANEELSSIEKEKLDIENVEEEDGQYIEMNLGLGVYDLKPKDAATDSEDEELIIPNRTSNNTKPNIQMMDED